ncbi:MAG: uracil-DNA glycosylase family protein [Candidatus Eremiobacterota bacterium]
MQEVFRRLNRALARLEFGPPVTHVYNPLEYALEPCLEYYRRFGQGTRDTLLLGMNPGPWGMAQTGVPFGEVEMVRDWLGIRGQVGSPAHPHPQRPVQGFDCPRSEVSGRRLWGWVRERFGTPDAFFRDHFIANYCPLMFMEESGRNRTPDRLPAREREPLFRACDEALAALVDRLQPRRIIGVGRFAEQRAREALAGRDLKILRVTHPSPANPGANRGWGEELDALLAARTGASGRT